MDHISIDDFKKFDMRVGTILEAKRVEGTDKLITLHVDLGEEKPRQIVSGIAEYVTDPNKLVGKQCVFAANLEPRMIRGFESNGMILALTTDNNQFAFLVPDREMPPGTSVA